MKRADAWLEVARRLDAGQEMYICMAVEWLRRDRLITRAAANKMEARIREDIGARWGRWYEDGEVGFVAYQSSDSWGGGDPDAVLPDDDMDEDDERAARVLAALMFAHEARGG